jgi:hypothetical protein
MAPRQRLLDAFVLSYQPVQRLVQLLLIDRPQLEHLAKRTDRRLLVEVTRRGQLGGGIREPRHDHGKAQRHLPAGLSAALGQDAAEPELTQDAERRRDMSVRQAPHQRQCLCSVGATT